MISSALGVTEIKDTVFMNLMIGRLNGLGLWLAVFGDDVFVEPYPSTESEMVVYPAGSFFARLRYSWECLRRLEWIDPWVLTCTAIQRFSKFIGLMRPDRGSVNSLLSLPYSFSFNFLSSCRELCCKINSLKRSQSQLISQQKSVRQWSKWWT